MYNVKYYSYYIIKNSCSLQYPCFSRHCPQTPTLQDVNCIYRADIICWNDLELIGLRRATYRLIL